MQKLTEKQARMKNQGFVKRSRFTVLHTRSKKGIGRTQG
jgi:hypothetical protein